MYEQNFLLRFSTERIEKRNIILGPFSPVRCKLWYKYINLKNKYIQFMSRKSNLKLGAGYPWAGHSNDKADPLGRLYGFDMIEAIRGAVLETGSVQDTFRFVNITFLDENHISTNKHEIGFPTHLTKSNST